MTTSASTASARFARLDLRSKGAYRPGIELRAMDVAIFMRSYVPVGSQDRV